MSVETRGFQSSGVDDGLPPLQAFPIPGWYGGAFTRKREHIVVGVFSGISQQKPLADMEHPLVLDLTSVRNDVVPADCHNEHFWLASKVEWPPVPQLLSFHALPHPRIPLASMKVTIWKARYRHRG
jgi:hypothetical protein